VRLKTPKPPELPSRHFREQIVAQSHARYCRRAAEVMALRRARWVETVVSLGNPQAVEFPYDEL